MILIGQRLTGKIKGMAFHNTFFLVVQNKFPKSSLPDLNWPHFFFFVCGHLGSLKIEKKNLIRLDLSGMGSLLLHGILGYLIKQKKRITYPIKK